ncbi:MAG: hypothetical protein Q8P02_00800, partial [Candidatus Micrarchaeota archaeon]|nr:hypothetical protein [Candidatus Micrarchaeota archaeon]
AESLSPQDRPFFESVFSEMVDDATLAPKPGSAETVLKRLRDAKAANEPGSIENYHRSVGFVAALDPDLSKALHPEKTFDVDLFGRDKSFFDGLTRTVDPDATHDSPVLMGMLESRGGTYKPGKPLFNPEEFDLLLSRYGELPPERLDFLKKSNQEFTAQLDDTVRALSDGQFGLSDVKSIVLDQSVGGALTPGLLGKGGFREAYLARVTFKDGTTKELIAKTGFTHPKEVELFKALSEKGITPKTYGFLEGKPFFDAHGDVAPNSQGFLFQEYVEGSDLSKFLQTAAPEDAAAAVRSVAHTDADLALSGYAVMDLDGLNFIVRKSDGKAVVVDLDPKFIIPTSPEDVLAVSLLYRDNDIPAQYLPAYFDSLQTAMGPQYGDVIARTGTLMESFSEDGPSAVGFLQELSVKEDYTGAVSPEGTLKAKLFLINQAYQVEFTHLTNVNGDHEWANRILPFLGVAVPSN